MYKNKEILPTSFNSDLTYGHIAHKDAYIPAYTPPPYIIHTHTYNIGKKRNL